MIPARAAAKYTIRLFDSYFSLAYINGLKCVLAHQIVHLRHNARQSDDNGNFTTPNVRHFNSIVTTKALFAWREGNPARRVALLRGSKGKVTLLSR